MSLLEDKSAADQGKAMGSNDHATSNAAYQQIPSRPDRDGWIAFLRDRLPFSFRKIKKEKRIFLLAEPIPPPHPRSVATYYPELNFWSRALAFYASGKIADAHTLVGVLSGYQQLLIQNTVDQTRSLHHEMFIYAARDGIWDSEQLHRLLLLLNRNRLDRERASTTLIVHALEFLLKAMCVHCNFHLGGKFFFKEGHDLYALYKSLPEDCRDEVDAESVRFYSQYEEDREHAKEEIGSIVGQLVDPEGGRPFKDQALRSDLLRIRDTVRRKRYLDVLTQNETTVGGVCKREGSWLEEALKGAGQLTSHRYGAAPRIDQGWVLASDRYDECAIAHAQLPARFFLEHLFGVADPSRDPWRCKV